MEKWTLLSSKSVLNSEWLRVYENAYELPDGKGIIPQYFIEERNDSAVCVCFDGKKFILAKQYRAGIDSVTYCHPGGRLEDDDKSLQEGALREVFEEIGYVEDQGRDIVYLGSFAQIPAVSVSRVHMFLVWCHKCETECSSNSLPDEIDAVALSPSELKETIDNGGMDCLACATASFLAFEYLFKDGYSLEN